MALHIAMKLVSIASAVLMSGFAGYAQRPGGSEPGAANRIRLEPPVPTGPPINSAPNPYRKITDW